MKGYANPDLLWSPGRLRERLGEERLCLLDVRPTEEYVASHIPGAVHLDLFGISVNDTRPEPLASFFWMVEGLFGARGVSPEKTIVLYNGQTGVRAARGFWLLEYFGLKDVHVLQGGFEAWEKGGHPTDKSPVKPKAAKFQGGRVEERLATCQSILEGLGRKDFVVVDARSDGEYFGKDVQAKRAGRIPGAVHIEWKQNLEGGAFKEAEDLRSLYAAAGVTPEKEVVSHCQGGYRSAHVYLALRLLGYPRVRNYVGSWAEWGNREDLPIEAP